ncbi:MAG: hypothetical protein V1797_19570 [Pseudomonadota bacterium]
MAWALALAWPALAAATAPQAWSLADWDAAWWTPPGSGAPRPGRVVLAYAGAPARPVAIFPGSDQEPGILVSRPLPLKPGSIYELSFELLRPQFVNGHYLSVALAGREFLLDQHCIAGGWQSFRMRAAYAAGAPPLAVFRNDTPSRFMLRNPELRAVAAAAPPDGRDAPPAPLLRPFPLGVYETEHADWPRVQACGFNLVTAGLPLDGLAAALAEAAGLGLRVIPVLPAEPGKLRAWPQALAGLDPGLRPPFFYLVDEPELRSFDPALLGRLRAELRAGLPWARLATAMVRPGLTADYAAAYDAIFMDQYPVPGQPLNWLADSVGEARAALPAGCQVWAVVQAFALPKLGWPRLPTAEEMQALAGSALAAGAQGLLFYTWPQIATDPAHHAHVSALLARIKALEPWLPLAPGPGTGLGAGLTGRALRTPSGGDAVRVGHGLHQGRRLLLAVNQTPYPATLRLQGLGPAPLRLAELWSGGEKAAIAGELRETIEPFGVRAWAWPTAARP